MGNIDGVNSQFTEYQFEDTEWQDQKMLRFRQIYQVMEQINFKGRGLG